MLSAAAVSARGYGKICLANDYNFVMIRAQQAKPPVTLTSFL